MTSQISIDKQRSAQTRVELTLTRITSFWNVSSNGARFSRELIDFLRAIDNKNTLQSYCFSILEFFDWYQKSNNTIVTPDQIRRSDAVEYSKWLRSRETGLEQWRVEHDPARDFDAKILEIVKKSPGCDIRHVREELARIPGLTSLREMPDANGNLRTMRVLTIDIDQDAGGLAKRLACLVSVKNLFRTPSINQIRAKLTDINLGPIDATRVGIDFKVDPGIFKYYLPRQDKDEVERSGTVVARLSALSSLWEHFRNSGENTGIDQQLIKHNIWEDPLEPMLEQAKSQAQVYRAQKTPNVEVIDRLIATTFVDTYREKALQAAQAKLRGYQVKVPIRRTTFSDMRDRALLILMVTMGPRAIEITRAKRGDISGTPPMLTITGKRNKKRLVAVPPVAYLAISELEQKIQLMAENRVKYGSGSSFHVQRLSPDAPLIPAVIYWGKNAGTDVFRGLTRQAISAILKRRSLKAGLPPGTLEYAQAHPHGLRHLFANIARDSGTTMPDIQAMLGHSSMSTTGRYVEQHRPEALMAEAFKPRAPLAAAPSITFQAPLAPMVPMVAGAPSQVPVAFAEAITPPPVERKPAKPKPVKTIEIKRPGQAQESPAQTPPEPAVARKRTRKEFSAVNFVEEIYENNWGEQKNRQRLGAVQSTKAKHEAEEELPKKLSMAERALLYAKPLERAMRAIEEEPEGSSLETEDSSKKLNQVYIGKSSGFLWWSGPGGKLKPEMPVISPNQALYCNEETRSNVCSGLTGLWQKWMSQEGRGPTAASALVLWVVKSLNISAIVNREATGRKAEFVPLDAPVEATEATHGEKGEDRLAFREHDPERIITWFSQVAWQYRVSKAGDKQSEDENTKSKPRKDKREKDRREPDVLDTPVDVPDYYQSTDPVGDLPAEERNELLDWLSALTGQAIRDKRERFQGASRVEICDLLGMMHQFVKLADSRFEARHDKKMEKAADIGKLMVTLDENIKAKIDQYTRGRVKDFSLKDLRREKVQKRKLQTEERDATRGRSVVFLKIILDLFGEEAANDLAIRYVAQGPLKLSIPCKKSSARTGEPSELVFPEIDLADFFRIKGDSIHHDESVEKEFARKTGAHSECVARRIARDLWELKKLPKKSGRMLERQDQVALAICTLAEYRVPCPQYQESELRSRLGSSRDPVPVYEAWKRVVREKKAIPEAELEESRTSRLAEELSEELAGQATPTRGFNENPRARTYRINGKSAQALPSPIALIMLVVYA